MKRIGTALAAVGVAGGVLAAALFVGGSVFASGTNKDPASGASGEYRRLPSVVHGEGTWTYLDGSTRLLSGDVGEITSVDSTQVTIDRADDRSVTVPVGDSTCVRNDGKPAAIGDLAPGERALVVQENGSAVAIRAGLPRDLSGDATLEDPGSRPARPERLPAARPDGCLLLAGAVHGDLTVQLVDGSTKHLSVDRGMVSEVTGGSLSLLRRDGQTVTVSTDDATRVLLDARPASPSDLKAGQLAVVVSEGGHATRICAFEGLGRLAALRSGSGTTSG